MNDLWAFERQHVWHPYASMEHASAVYPVKSAHGVVLSLEDDRQVIDGMASWWCAIHGYNVPELNEAIETQLKDMAHVMFGGLTHRPAAELAQLLLSITPQQMQHVFFADSGSVSVEVALKMALQYWQAQGKKQKHRFMALKHAYHGDTFAAMSVCDPISGMHHLFQGVLPKHVFADVNIASIEQQLSSHQHELAALIVEPLVQGAGGMRLYDASLLNKIRQLCDQYDVLLVVDEIATGFGRTGTMFACEQAAIEPDIMCVGKALTAGYMTLAATLCSDKVSQGIHADGAGVLMHGPTFMANPLACAVALASLRLLLDSPWQLRVQKIEKHLHRSLGRCRSLAAVADVRVKGAIGVLEMKQPLDVQKVQAQLIDAGVWLRPFGKLLYTMPPYVVSDAELMCITDAMCAVAEHLST